MSFKEFIEEKEKGLIKAIGYDNWFEKKVYLVSEVIKFYEEYSKLDAQVGVSE